MSFPTLFIKQYATREVGYFLEDSERSKQYVEMRRVAMARGNDLGIEDYIQFAAAFLVGMMGVPALNALHSLQVCAIIQCVVCCTMMVLFSLDVIKPTNFDCYLCSFFSLVCQPRLWPPLDFINTSYPLSPVLNRCHCYLSFLHICY